MDGGDYTLWADNYAATPDPIDAPAAAALPVVAGESNQDATMSVLSEQTALTESDAATAFAPLLTGALSAADEPVDASSRTSDELREESNNRSTADGPISTDDRAAQCALLHYLAETFDSAADSDLTYGIGRKSDPVRR